MKTSFRQGLARYQTDISANPTFLQKSSGAGDFIDLLVQPDPTIIIFAHRDATYVVEETKTVLKAWGPFNGVGTKYLYWDINLVTGEITRSYTLLPPMNTAIAPAHPSVDQHWFDTSETVMKVWNGFKWVEKVRVFAGHLSSSWIIVSYPLGSQAGIVGNFEAGNIVLDSYNKPLRQSNGTFVTTVTSMIIVNNSSKKVKFEAEVMSGLAAEPIPKFSLVQMKAGRRIELARSSQFMSRIAGIVVEDLYENEPGYVTTDGLIRNEAWSWPAQMVNRPVFCGKNGELTLLPPIEGVLQVAGFVYDTDAVYINIFPPIILDDVRNLEPAPPAPPEPVVPIADFYSSVTSGVAPLTVTFTSTSIGETTRQQWDFTNDGTIDATAAQASYTYTVPGEYSVRLRAINDYGHDDEVKHNLIKVEQPTSTGIFTNLGIKLTYPKQVQSNQTFNVSVLINNDGYRTATNVSRVITIPDIAGEQLAVTNLPVGSSKVRVGRATVVTLPLVATLPTGLSYGPTSFSLRAPARVGSVKIQAVVYSPQIDITIGDNTTTVELEVRP